LQCLLYFMLASNQFWWIHSILCLVNLVLMWTTILWTMLWKALEAKPCDCQGSMWGNYCSKRLAWLVKQLVVSSHEFSFLFTLFLKSFSKHKHHVFIFVFIVSFSFFFLFLFFSFWFFWYLEELVNTLVTWSLMLLSPLLPVDLACIATLLSR